MHSEEDEESDGIASNQSAEDGSINENMNNCSNNGSIGMCLLSLNGLSFYIVQCSQAYIEPV